MDLEPPVLPKFLCIKPFLGSFYVFFWPQSPTFQPENGLIQRNFGKTGGSRSIKREFRRPLNNHSAVKEQFDSLRIRPLKNHSAIKELFDH